MITVTQIILCSAHKHWLSKSKYATQWEVRALHETQESTRHLSQHTNDRMLVQLIPGKAAKADNHYHCPFQWWARATSIADWDWTSRRGCCHCLQQWCSRLHLLMHALDCTSHCCRGPYVCYHNLTTSSHLLPQKWKRGASLSHPNPSEIKTNIHHIADSDMHTMFFGPSAVLECSRGFQVPVQWGDNNQSCYLENKASGLDSTRVHFVKVLAQEKTKTWFNGKDMGNIHTGAFESRLCTAWHSISNNLASPLQETHMLYGITVLPATQQR